LRVLTRIESERGCHLEDKRLIIKAIDVLNALEKKHYYIFVRAQGLETVGIMTKIDRVWDGGWGIYRSMAVGVTRSYNKFQEYTDRQNKRTGELEDIVMMYADIHYMTARNSISPEDDNKDNFTYIFDPHTYNNLKDRLDEIQELKRQRDAMKKKAEEAVNKAERYLKLLEVAQSQANSYKARTFNFMDKLGEAEAKVEYLTTQLKINHVNIIRQDGFLTQKMKDAYPLGKLEGMDSADIIREASKKKVESEIELDKTGINAKKQNIATKEDLNNIENNLINALRDSKKPKKTVDEKNSDESTIEDEN
jgi:hypothetical protein